MKIRNWTKFQHYKHRRPPWLKLYRELLEDPDWMAQSDGAKAVLLELWMVASDTDDGTLPSLDTLAWRLRRASGPLAEILLVVNTKFLDGASEMLAGCVQHATSEKRQSREETEGELQRGIASVTVTATDLSTGNGHDIDPEIDAEESNLLRLLVSLQASGAEVQALCDDIGRESKRAPFNAHRALVGGKTGIPRTSDGLTVRRRLIDALEARQRAQDAPIISENNRQAFDAIDRVADRLKARRDGRSVPREIEG